jgi:ATP-binding cassette subfamily C protein LapB
LPTLWDGRFYKGNPAGYDLKIKERGVGLSGGQRQSINLSRALLHEPKYLGSRRTDKLNGTLQQRRRSYSALGDYLTDRTMVAVDA